jgi:hypothetical protein
MSRDKRARVPDRGYHLFKVFTDHKEPHPVLTGSWTSLDQAKQAIDRYEEAKVKANE